MNKHTVQEKLAKECLYIFLLYEVTKPVNPKDLQDCPECKIQWKCEKHTVQEKLASGVLMHPQKNLLHLEE